MQLAGELGASCKVSLHSTSSALCMLAAARLPVARPVDIADNISIISNWTASQRVGGSNKQVAKTNPSGSSE